MRRTARVLILFALAPFLMGGGGGGGFFPPTTNLVLSSETISAFIVLDPHNCKGDQGDISGVPNPPSNVTTTCKQAFISLRDTHGPSQVLYAQGSFTIPAGFNLSLGCDPSRTNTRFVGGPDMKDRVSFDAWMNEEFMKALFRQLGRTVSAVTNVPVITQVLNSDPGGPPGQCMADPANKEATGHGWLFLEAEVGFAVPPKKP